MGVEPYVFGMREYTPSTYSDVVMAGTELRSFKTLSETLINLGLLLEKPTRPIYVHLYFDKIDALCHENGGKRKQASQPTYRKQVGATDHPLAILITSEQYGPGRWIKQKGQSVQRAVGIPSTKLVAFEIL